MERRPPLENHYPPPVNRPRRRTRAPLIALVVLLALALILGVACWFALRYARQELTQRIQEVSRRWGVDVQWRSLDISLAGSVTFEDVSFRTIHGGRMEGQLQTLQFRIPPSSLWNRQLPDEVQVRGLTARLDAEGLRSLRRSAPSGVPSEVGPTGRSLPRLEVDTLDAVFHLDGTRSVACHGQEVSAQPSGRFEATGTLDCRAPALGLATGPFEFELSQDPSAGQMPWQARLTAHEDSQASLAGTRFGQVLASFGPDRGSVRFEAIQLQAPVPEGVLSEPPQVRLDRVELSLAREQGGWEARLVEAGPGEIRILLPRPVEEPQVALVAEAQEEQEAVALEEAADAADEARPILIDWEGLQASLERHAGYLDQLLRTTETATAQLLVTDIDLVLSRGPAALMQARLDSLAVQQGRATAVFSFADHRIDLVLGPATPDAMGPPPDGSLRPMTLTVEAQDVDLRRVSRTLGQPKLFQGYLDLSARLDAGVEWSLTLSVDLPELVFAHPAVSPLPLELRPLHWDMVARFSAAARRPLTVDLTGSLGDEVRGTASLVASERNDTTQLDLDLHIDETQCRTLLEAIPRGLFIHFSRSAVQIAGRTGFDAHVRYRLGDHRSFRLSLPEEEGFPGTCEITGLPLGYRPEVLLSNGYRHQIPALYATEEIWVGPGTDGYWRLDDLPPYVPAIMYLTEQRGFYEDPVVSASRISKAVRVNLIYGRWAFGGSTIAQQLVKNLFLDRGKTLARKLEEAIIAWEMGEVVPRDRILELYVNCIEFAPNTFGIEAGAQYYFGIHANQLSPIQASWLAGLKPSPRSGERHRSRGHSPTGGRWPRRLRHHLQLLADRGFIDQGYVDDHAPYVVHFIDPDDPQPLLEPYYRIDILE